MTVLHYFNERREGLAANHESLVKFSGEDDPHYRKVMKELWRMGMKVNKIRSASASKSQICRYPFCEIDFKHQNSRYFVFFLIFNSVRLKPQSSTASISMIEKIYFGGNN